MNCQAVTSSKKQMNKFVFLSWRLGNTWNKHFYFKVQVFLSRQDRTNSFVCFLGEVTAGQLYFQIYWPLILNLPKPKTTQPRSWYSSKKEYWHCSWTWETNFLLTKGTKGAELFNELGYCCLNSISPQKKVVVSFSLLATMRSSPFWSLIWITISHSCFF